MNKLIIMGRLTADAEIFDVREGLKICKFTIAVNGFKKDDVSFFDVTAFNKQAEAIVMFVKKGQRLLIEGELKQDKFVDKEGKNRSKVGIILRSFEFIEKKGADEEDDVNF